MFNHWHSPKQQCFFLLLYLLSDIVTGAFLCKDNTHKCLNGGSCVEGIAKTTGQLIQVCDCQDAINQEGNRYVGLYCELEAPKENQFCINGGIPQTISSGVIICSCPAEYTGAYCELAKNSAQIQALMNITAANVECSMECWNGGTCAFGRRAPTTAELALYPNYDPHDDDNMEFLFEHCQCPDRFYGSQCESSFDVCTVGDNDSKNDWFYCHNNATCVYFSSTPRTKIIEKTSDGNPLSQRRDAMCNCTAAHRPGKRFTGRYCEYQNLITCNQNAANVSERKFCTNGGTCTKNVVTGHWHCACPEGYGGDHCEDFGLNDNNNFLLSDTTANQNKDILLPDTTANQNKNILLPDTTADQNNDVTTTTSQQQGSTTTNNGFNESSTIFPHHATVNLIFLAVSITISLILLLVAFVVFGVKGDEGSTTEFPTSIRMMGRFNNPLASSLHFPDIGNPQQRRSIHRRSSQPNSDFSGSDRSMGSVSLSPMPHRPSFRSTMSALPASLTRVPSDNGGSRQTLSNRMLGMTPEEQKTLTDLM